MTQHLINRPAKLAPCPRCHHPTLTATTGGLTIRADPTPLTINQEIAALLAGKSTYDILIHGLPRRMYLEWRHLTRIKAPRKHAIVTTHTCPPHNNPNPTPETELTIRATTPQPETPPF